ncbi:MAG: SAP domain-containing protein [Sulfobacillus sp.]
MKRKPFSSSKESLSDAQLVPTNWASSQPHLALLEKFLSAREVKDWFLELWEPAFGTNTQRVIDGLVAHGALELAPTIADLKVMLSSRGLKVSGKKAELIQRLLEADPKGMEVSYAHRMILRCTPAASQVVGRWKSECESAYETATDNVIAALRNRDFKEAIRTADVYRKNKFVLPRTPEAAAMMIKSAPRSLKERANDLAAVFTMRPKILRELQPEQWEGLYLNYAVGELLGRTAPEKCMPGFTGVGVMNSATATRMLSFYVKHQGGGHSDLAQMRESGIKKVKIIGIGGCEACAALNNKTFLLDELPELPYEKCTCDLGCRCVTRAVLPWTKE